MATPMRNSVVVILGATGTGKTKLSLELARRFNGEIISADSMQVYKGLDIITNKATQQERQAVPHHLIDCLSPLVEDSTVVEFRDKAVPIIDKLLENNKLPIIVGGTNYYIESVVWNNLIDKQDVQRAVQLNEGKSGEKFPKLEGFKSARSLEAATQDLDACPQNEEQSTASLGYGGKAKVIRDKNERLTTPELYTQLMEVDRPQALKLHPNDRRKLLRALEVYHQHGVPMSEVYKAQHEKAGQDVYSGPLRYPHTCMFWLQCDKEVLKQRLDGRVDQMIEDGLVSELTGFHTSYNTQRQEEGQETDYTTGIFQSIGLKEFHDYLMLNEVDRQSVKGQQLFEQGKEDLKVATRRYARIQNRFVTNRLLKRKGPADYKLPVYGLDTTDVSKWAETVSKPAVSILQAILQGKKPDIEPIDPDDHVSTKSIFVYNECKPCGKVFPIEQNYLEHMKTKRHKHMDMKYKRKLVELSKILDQHTDQLQEEQTGQSDEDPESIPDTDNTLEKDC